MKSNVDTAIKLFSNSDNVEDIIRPSYDEVKTEYVELAKSFIDKYPTPSIIDTLQSERIRKISF